METPLPSFSNGDDNEENEIGGIYEAMRRREGLEELINGDEEMEQDEEEFKPLEHLVEPMDDDFPVECPMLDSFPLIDQSIWWKELLAEGSASKAARKRHHRDAANIPPSNKPAPHSNLFLVFQQCREI